MTQQFLVTAGLLLVLVLLMSIGMIIKGRPMRRSCGGIAGGDSSECAICDGGEKPENCPE